MCPNVAKEQNKENEGSDVEKSVSVVAETENAGRNIIIFVVLVRDDKVYFEA